MGSLRFKSLASGKYSIYFDHYDENTKSRHYEFLKLHVTKDYSKIVKIADPDKKIMEQALQMLERANQKFGIPSLWQADDDTKAVVTLVSFIEKEQALHFQENAKHLLKHIKTISKGKDISMSVVNLKWIERFNSYLSNKLSLNTCNGYLLLLKTYFNKAIQQSVIVKNPFESFKIQKTLARDKAFLTVKECHQLKNTPIDSNPQIRDAFLFALHSGMRWDDIKCLQQSQVTVHSNKSKGVTIALQFIKSSQTYSIKLSKQAFAVIEGYLDARKVLVFDRLPNKSGCSIKLRLWGAMAGIEKNVCFSMARNTYARNLLAKGGTRKGIHIQMGIAHASEMKAYESMI